MLKFLFSAPIMLFSVYLLPAQVESINVEINNLSGGGFQSDVSITEDGLTVYSSADVAGIFKSTDGGLLYKSIGEGLRSTKVASLAITPDNDQILYAGTGDKGGSGGLFRSIDGGDRWNMTGAGNSAQFAGNHSADVDSIPNSHPRSNGDLIIVDPGTNPSSYLDDIVIAGTYKAGVRGFSKGGDEVLFMLNDSSYVRSLAHHVDVPYKAYAAIYFTNKNLNGIYEIDYSDINNATSTLVYQTPNPEGVTVLGNGRVYAAIGKAGIVKYNGTSWNLKINDIDTDNENRQWTAVTGYSRDNSNDVIYIGLNNLGGARNNQNYSSIWQSVDGGNSWTPLVNAADNVNDVIYGQTFEWWFRTDAFGEAGLGRTNSVVSSIDVALGLFPNVASDDIIYVSGRGGIWKSMDGGTSWNPAVNNMQVTANRGVAVNPNDPNQIAIANTDFVVLATNSKFENSDIARDKPQNAESRAYDIAFDATGNEVIVGVGDRDRNDPGGGEVYIKSTNTFGDADQSWINTNLKGITSENNGRVRAITSGYHNGNSPTSQTILAAVEGEGVFRYHAGSWQPTNGNFNLEDTERSNFVWPDNGNSGVVYLLDLSDGFHRSTDGGQNWTNIWPSMSLNNKDFFNTGYITADDSDPTTLYVSLQGGPGSPIGTNFKVYRMTGADQGIFQNPTNDDDITDISMDTIGGVIKRPGPIVLGPDGRLWLTEQQNSQNNITAGLYVMENPKTDLSFIDLSTDAYRNHAIQPSGIDVSSDGYVYISQSGTGLVKISYTVKESEITTFLEAENAIFGNNWMVTDGPAACNCSYLLTPSTQATNHLPIDNPDDIVTFPIMLDEAGLYKVFARIRTENADNDSFWVRANQGDWKKWNRINWPHNTSSSVFKWSQVGDYTNGNDFATPVEFNLNEGENEIQFAIREPGAQLDKIFVTNQDQSWINTVQNNSSANNFSLKHLVTESCPGDSITFIPGLAGSTITIKESEFDILKNLHIQGLSSDLIKLSGNDEHRLFHVHEYAELSLSHLILRNGASNTDGGAILNEGILNLESVIMEFNSEAGNPKSLTNNAGGKIFIRSGVTEMKE